jgi:hypothetical protein
MSKAEMNVDDGGGRQRTVRVDYPANSMKAKERKRPEKVIDGEVTRRKQGLASRVARTFISEDVDSVAHYLVMEVLVPAAKNMISDAFSQGIERILFGDSRPRSSPARSGGYSTYTSYNRARDDRPPFPGRQLSRQQRTVHDFNDIILSSRGEAEDVLDSLRELISQYDTATVADLYDLVGISSEFTDDKWGWSDLRSASVRAIRGGYLLNLPRTISLA